MSVPLGWHVVFDFVDGSVRLWSEPAHWRVTAGAEGQAVSDAEDDIPDDPVYFVGPCTCEHEPGEHGWMGCEVEGCPCEAAWEE